MSKFWTVVLWLLCIGSWINFASALAACALAPSLTSWDGIKLLIDLGVASCWTFLLVWRNKR